MNVMFGEWYRAVNIEPRTEELGYRWQGIDKVKTTSDHAVAMNLVLLFLGHPGIAEEFVAWFRQIFFDVDNSFRMASNDIEFQVLAGASLSAIFDRQDSFSDGAALGLLACGAPDIRKKFILRDVLQQAVDHLFNRAAVVRTVSPNARMTLPSIDGAVEAVKAAAASPATLGAPLEAAFRSLADSLAKVNQNNDVRLAILQRQHEVLAEEANILWWLYGGVSRQNNKAFDAEDSTIAGLMAAKDLAELTTVLPPPRAASAYLSRCLEKHKSATCALRQVGEGVALEKGLSRDNLFPVTTLLTSVADGRTIKNAASWVAKNFLLGNSAIPVEALSRQFYRELLAARFVVKVS